MPEIIDRLVVLVMDDISFLDYKKIEDSYDDFAHTDNSVNSIILQFLNKF